MGAATHAITMTTLTTVLTFGSLLLTSTPAIRSLGILMGIGVTAALVGALGLLCPILVGQRARGFVRGED
jgi:predicted RND superfamily exporter protein